MLTVSPSMSLSAQVSIWVQPLPDLQYPTFLAFLGKCSDVCALTRLPRVTFLRIPVIARYCIPLAFVSSPDDGQGRIISIHAVFQAIMCKLCAVRFNPGT